MSELFNYVRLESQWLHFPPEPEQNVEVTFSRIPTSPQIDPILMEPHIGKIRQTTSSGLPSPQTHSILLIPHTVGKEKTKEAKVSIIVPRYIDIS